MTYTNSIYYNHELVDYLDPNVGLKDEYFQNVLGFIKQWLADTPAFELKTSGSTGIPKTITIRREQMVASAIATMSYLKPEHDMPVTVCIDSRYVGGKMQLVRALSHNLRLHIFPPSSGLAENLSGLDNLGLISLVPLQLYQLLREAPQLLNKAKSILIGGGPVNEGSIPELQKINTPVYHTYGMTETVSHIALKLLNTDRSTHAFNVLPGVSCTTDSRSCLVINGAVTGDVDVVTNDIVEFINPSSFVWKGRFDDMINSGGIKIFPEEIDASIHQEMSLAYPHCAFFTFGIPDDVLGQKLVLFVEAANPNSHDDMGLLEKLKKILPRYHSPRRIVFSVAFQRTHTGKIKKKETAYSVLS